MTPEQRTQLMNDLRTRRAIRSVIAENSRNIVSMELGISTTTVWHVEKGVAQKRPGTGVTPDIADEVQRRRAIWESHHERMQDYRLTVLAERYGVSVKTVWCFDRQVQDEQQVQAQLERSAA